jgi:DNA replication protein DnaC
MDSEIFDKAQAILTNRRMKAVSENEERIREVNTKIPQIREINEVLFNTGKELISIISNGRGNDVTDKIEQLRQYNLGAQAMCKKMLTEHGYPENYLDIHYNCPKCSDTGYNGSKFCDCFNTLCGKLAADKLNTRSQLKPSSFESFSLSYYSGENYTKMKNIFEYVKQYAATFKDSGG